MSKKEPVFKKHLSSIKATIVAYDDIKKLESYIPEFVSITWLDGIEDTEDFLKSKDMTRLDVVREMFHRRTLPTALETVHITFFLEGLTLGAVTHIIRHRMFSFSAQSTDPRSAYGDDILLSEAFDEVGLQEEAIELLKKLNDLYQKALDRGLSYYDARNYLPRAKEAKYFMSGNIMQFISFINTRLGRTNQPYEDNILAVKMRKALLEAYPEVADILEKQMPVEAIQHHYINAINEKLNLNTFPPDPLHKKELERRGIDYSKAKFSHDKPRTEYPGFKEYERIFNENC